MYMYIDTVGIAWKYEWEHPIDTVCLERLQIWNWNKKTHEMLLKWYGIAGKGGAKVFHMDDKDGDRYLKVNPHCDLS